MATHVQREIEQLKRRLVSYGAQIEETLDRAVEAVTRRDAALAERIIADDTRLDREEVSIEEECLKILALYQPVAADLRFVVAVLKMNNDLERLGDLGSNIAKRAIVLARNPDIHMPVDFASMADLARSMVKRCLDALVNGDAGLARRVCDDDDQLDESRRQAQARVIEMMHAAPDKIEPLLAVMSLYRHLERIGDMATNVCEDVIYMIHGDIVRHAQN